MQTIQRVFKILVIYFIIGIIWLLLTNFLFVPLGWGLFAAIIIGVIGFSAPIVFITILIMGAKDYLQYSSQEKAQNVVSLQKYYIPQIIAFLMGAVFLTSGYFIKDFWQIGLGVFGLIVGIVGLFLRKQNMDVNKIAENYEKHKKRNNIIFIGFLAILVIADIIYKIYFK